MPSAQEAKRLHACNAEVDAKHFVALLALVFQYGLDDYLILNLHESIFTSGKDAKGKKCEKRFMHRISPKDTRLDEFISAHA